MRIDEILDRPAITREEPYEEWGVEDARVTWLEEGGLREDNGQVFFIAEGISIKVPREKTAKAKATEPLALGTRPEDLRVDSSGDPSVEGDDRAKRSQRASYWWNDSAVPATFILTWRGAATA